MRYAPFLNEQGRIGFVAPSFGCNIEPYHTAFQNALKQFEGKGYQAVLGPNCYAGEGIGISNTPEKCAQELMEYYCTDDNDVLISCGGGELMCEVLAFLDFDRLSQAPPKWYMGYSDNTNMTFLQATLCDTAAIYGPCAAAFGMEPWHPAIHDALAVLKGEKLTVSGYGKWEKEGLKDELNPLAPYHVTEPSVLRLYKPGVTEPEMIPCRGKAVRNCISGEEEAAHEDKSVPSVRTTFSGRLIGGCMDCLVTLLGTEFDKVATFQEKYREDGFIWFLEACDLNVMAIRRAVWQMEHAGWFRYVKGFLIGRPLCHGEELMGLDQYHAVVDLLAGHKVPIVMDADIGHIPPMMPIICGSMGDVTVYEDGMTLAMRCE